MATISRWLLAGAVAARLVPLTAGPAAVQGYLGQIGRGLDGKLGGDPAPKDPAAGDLRVRPYFIVFPGAGAPGLEPDLADQAVDLTAPFQITVAGGDIDDVIGLIDRVHNRMWRWAPGLLGTAPDVFIAGPLQVPPGYDPGPVRTDNGISPPRQFLPLQYRLTAHT